ncbi:regulator of nonsense transcripts 3B isoform X2 [Eucyclogobius newberryi]|uniref:regulator of nonsense transcripts 3B isoform X2 n=1 Tax=Eucyclogobius newberryi TaxID=166745 RepID=UPI003B5B01A8
MMEDKENTRPKDLRVDIKCEDGEKSEKSKEKRETMTKIIIRRLPPTITKEELEEQLQPLPEMDYMEFFSNDTSLYPHLFARAYINFKNQEDIVLFRDRFDGYVFIDSKGQEYPAVVEFAPFQKTAKKRTKKKDAKCGTIVEDLDYKKFLEYYNGNDEKLTCTPETLLEEIEAKSKELGKKSTPLLDFLKNKQRLREEKKEERRRRELERKRLRDEERRKWREEDRKKRKESEKFKRHEKTPEKDKDQVRDEPKIKACSFLFILIIIKKLLKKPERSDDGDSEKTKEKFKKPEKLNKDDRPVGITDHKRRHTNDYKDDRGRRDEEGRKEYKDHTDRDRDREMRDREKERRLREKERLRRQDDERRRRRERQDGENTYKKREDEFKREKEHGIEKKKLVNMTDSPPNEKSTKENKEDSVKRERLRNKDRPAIQLYQPGARSRNRVTGADSTDKKSDIESTTKEND